MPTPPFASSRTPSAGGGNSTGRAECPSLPAPRYCARVRHSAEANHAIGAGRVRQMPTPPVASARTPSAEGGNGTRRAECPSLPAPRYCARVRHSAEANHANDTGGVRDKSGFRPTRLRRSEPCGRCRRSPQQKRIPPYKTPSKRTMRTIPAESATKADSALQGFAEANHADDTGGVRNRSGFRPTRLRRSESSGRYRRSPQQKRIPPYKASPKRTMRSKPAESATKADSALQGFAEANHANDTGGVRNRSGFRPTRLRRSESCGRYRRSPQQKRIPPYKASPKRTMRTIPAESATKADSALQGFAEANHADDTGGVRNKSGFRPTRLRRSESCERYRRSPQQKRIPPYKASPKRTMRTIPAESATKADSALQGFAEANHADDTGGVRNKSGFRPTRLRRSEACERYWRSAQQKRIPPYKAPPKRTMRSIPVECAPRDWTP